MKKKNSGSSGGSTLKKHKRLEDHESTIYLIRIFLYLFYLVIHPLLFPSLAQAWHSSQRGNQHRYSLSQLIQNNTNTSISRLQAAQNPNSGIQSLREEDIWKAETTEEPFLYKRFLYLPCLVDR